MIGINIIRQFTERAGHQNYRSKNTDLLSMYGDKLMALHIHDNDESADQHHMPFDGNINWDVVMKKLTDINYKGPTVHEIMNIGYNFCKAPVRIKLAGVFLCLIK